MHLAPPHELKSLSSPWPFAWWGMDILGPFTKGLHQNKFLIVAVDYFTKWVEAEPLRHNVVQNTPFLQTRRTLPIWNTTSRRDGQWDSIHGQRIPRLPCCPGNQATFHFS
ncbi:retrotransposon-related protein [Trifolium pratense]|uniref:Retrotransposon-related protein n=1 Tax=Trifolium pratense TaxID=57577 RepID=A0A2K3K3K7_TRIPR|nr:retrotransposon-related protein [Trifolium pratense]